MRQFELAFADQSFRGVLLERAAARTCEAFWQMLPIRGDVLRNDWSDGCSYFLDRFPRFLGVLGYELENPQTEVAPGDLIWDPWIQELTLAHGEHARPRGAATVLTEDGCARPHRGCTFARITENLEGFASACERIADEGCMVAEIRQAR
jgi:hypothetical protein